jgi:hypothetical protein
VIELSRNVKNRILIGCNALMSLICLYKWIVAPSELSSRMQLWLIISPFVLLGATLPAGPGHVRVLHAALFMLTGAAAGLTIASAIARPESLWIVDWLWLPLVFFCAVLHYTPSRKDEYLR